MSAPQKLRTDAVVAIVVVIAIAVAAGTQGWRARSARWNGDARGTTAGDAVIDPTRAPELARPRGPRHDSPFNDAVTARAESLCVLSVESQLGFQLKETVAAKVMDSYGVGDRETGAGDSLDFDGLARTLSGRVVAWHCGMANLGAFPGSPMITHSEPR
jgi:hypothetical protein